MSDTPKTDRFYEVIEDKCLPVDARYYLMRIHAREMEIEFNTERALADRLAEALKACRCNAIVIQELRYGFDGDCGAIRHAGLIEDDCELAIAAWKEARSECR